MSENMWGASKIYPSNDNYYNGIFNVYRIYLQIDTQSTGTSECQSSLNTNENLIQRPKLLLTNSDDISPIQESTKEDLLYVCCQCSKSPSYNIGNNTCLKYVTY